MPPQIRRPPAGPLPNLALEQAALSHPVNELERVARKQPGGYKQFQNAGGRLADDLFGFVIPTRGSHFAEAETAFGAGFHCDRCWRAPPPRFEMASRRHPVGSIATTQGAAGSLSGLLNETARPRPSAALAARSPV